MSRYVLGIDLGTVNSCVAVVKDGKAVVLGEGNDNRIPSCVAIARGKELVGRPARRHGLVDPHNTVSAVKRLIGHPYDSPEVQSARSRAAYPIRPSPLGDVLLAVGGVELTPIQVSARILQRIKEVAEAALGTAVDSAVISVPAHFNDVQRKATKLAAEYAGLRVLRLVNEPTAAAFAYGYRKGRDFTLAVYDLGGGTFDITIMAARGNRFEVRATDGDSYLGGEDLDHAIEQWLAAEFQREYAHDISGDAAARLRMRDAAEKAKVELSQVEATRIEVPFVAQLADGSRPTFARALTRAQLEELVDPLIQRTLDLCRRCMDNAGIPRAAIDEVLLVGGQSRMPAVRKAVALFFGREARRDINPDEVVAMGAALYAYSLSADRLTREDEDAAEDQYAVAVKQTAVVHKLLNDVQLKIEKATPPDSKLRSRLSALLGDFAPEPGASAPAPMASSSPAGAGAPETRGADGGATEWDKREFELQDEPAPADSQPVPSRKRRPAAKAAKPAEPAGSPGSTGSEPVPRSAGRARLPTSIAKIREKLSGMGDVAHEALEALAAEIAAEATSGQSAKLAQETEQLSAQLAQSLALAREASDAAQIHLESAQQHASARRVELRDVTSHSLGIGSAGDLMTVLIEHNTAIPVERERIFTTHHDNQSEVEIRVYQGREQRASANQMLGSFVLEGIPAAPRMAPKINVAFRIDENGILSVSAIDRASGGLQSIRIEDPLGLQQGQPGQAAPTPEPSA